MAVPTAIPREASPSPFVKKGITTQETSDLQVTEQTGHSRVGRLVLLAEGRSVFVFPTMSNGKHEVNNAKHSTRWFLDTSDEVPYGENQISYCKNS